MSGKALFTFDPTLFQDDDGAADEKQYEEEAEDQTQETQENFRDGYGFEEESKEEVKVDENLY